MIKANDRLYADHGPGDPEAKPRPQIMVVDDDPVIGCVLAGALNRAGFEVEIFHHALHALDSLDSHKADGHKPEVAVVDWVMPDMDGLSLIDRLKARIPDLTTIRITSHGEHEVVEQAHRNGRVDMVLDKPFNLSDFLNTVSSSIRNKAAAPEPAPEPASDPLPERTGSAGRPEHVRGTLAGWLVLDGREAYFEHILESLIDAVMMLDRKGRVIYYNNGAQRMFCFRDQDEVSLSLPDFCPPDNALASMFAHFFGPHPPVQEQSEGYFIKAGGTRFYTIFSASLFQAGSHGSAVLLVVKDINASHLIFEQATAETRKLEKLALTDPLTGIYNRRHFDQRLAEEFRRVERYRSPLTLVMIDFDHFKKINDRFGHLVGDQVLRQGAEVFGQALRDVDTLSRWGGEEYMVLLPETNGEMGLGVVQRLHRLICEPEQWEKLAPGLRVTVSIGMISLPWAEGRSLSLTEVLDTMDRALYRAKKNGRNRIIRYQDEQGGFDEV
ncbi:MAG: diguanylate cyclase [Candidatus Adiutrix sp.]|jgi:diguanylate cyclase (GGDEF)-like protein/PAS domain S-box-containing protein|nr:diguanylate cyclase [Candidatus Adiutrix sp.]